MTAVAARRWLTATGTSPCPAAANEKATTLINKYVRSKFILSSICSFSMGKQVKKIHARTGDRTAWGRGEGGWVAKQTAGAGAIAEVESAAGGRTSSSAGAAVGRDGSGVW